MITNDYMASFVRYMSSSWFPRIFLSTVRVCVCRVPAGVAAVLVALGCCVSAPPVAAQTVIYDGSQDLNFFGSSSLTDDLALVNNPTNPDRAGIIESGADPNVLEQGDAAWFRSSARRMRNTNLGSASTAVGVDGDFMSSLFDATGATVDSNDAAGVGAGYVLYDAGATTGLQNLNISLYYNDPTPNAPDPVANNSSGSNVAVRVLGIQDTGDPANDPWGDDDFTFLAGSGFAGHFFSSGNPRANQDQGTNPMVDRLFLAESSLDETEGFNPDEIIAPSPQWQQLSFQFDAGSGYDYLIFAVGGVIQDSNTLGVDRFGFDNISFGPSPGTPGDFDGDDDVDGADFLEWQRTDGTPAGLTDWQNNYGPPALAAQAVPEPNTALLIAVGMSLLSQARSRSKS